MQKTLVVGASTNPGRYSNTAIRRLADNNIETTAFGIRGGTVSGVQIKDNLIDIKNDLDNGLLRKTMHIEYANTKIKSFFERET